jgi:acyl dehydratase
LFVAVRGVYTPAEEAMLEATHALFATLMSWDDSKGRTTVTEESMINMARAADPWNLLWRKPEYARGTRWRDIVAHPLYLDRLSGGGVGRLPASSECGHEHIVFVGEDWRFLLPVRKGDVYRVWRRRPDIVDLTPLNGESPRTFGLVEMDKDYVNQEDKVTAQLRVYTQHSFLPEKPKPLNIPEYAYTREELRQLADLIRQEHVRGAEPRYWQDVNLGDRTLPAVLGPTSMMDNMLAQVATPDFLEEATPREWFLVALDRGVDEEFIPGPAPGLFYVRGGPGGSHWSDHAAQAEGEAHATLSARLARQLMCRCVTNWMGDDAFLNRYRWRHLMRSPVGDALVARGQVVNKRVEGDARLVDLTVRVENLRGMVTDISVSTVALRSRTEQGGGML